MGQILGTSDIQIPLNSLKSNKAPFNVKQIYCSVLCSLTICLSTIIFLFVEEQLWEKERGKEKKFVTGIPKSSFYGFKQSLDKFKIRKFTFYKLHSILSTFYYLVSVNSQIFKFNIIISFSFSVLLLRTDFDLITSILILMLAQG